MSRLGTTLRILGYAAGSGLSDYSAAFTVRTWFLGWYSRILAQVLFFATIGSLLGRSHTRYLLIGNAVFLMTLHGLLTTASTTWERDSGTLPLLVAAPTPAPLVLAGRSLFWVPQGLACALGSLVLIGLPLHVSLPALRLLQCLPMLLLIGLSSYCLGLFLGALVLSFRREVGETLIRLGTRLAGEQKQPSPATQTPANPVSSPVHSDAAPAASAATNPSPAPADHTPSSTGSSQSSAPPTQLRDVPAQSPPQQASTIQQIEDLPATEEGGSGQKEFEQAKTILKGNHRQRDMQMAVALLWTGVRKGYVPAEVTLADLYARGDGIGRSCEQARVLLKAAVQKGSPEGRRRLDQLKRQGCPAR